MKPLICLMILLCLIFVCSLGWAEEIRWDDLVSAIVQVESGGNPNAVGKNGEIGLMQIHPDGALKEYSQWVKSNGGIVYASLYEPSFNKEVGLWYLHRLHDHYLKSIVIIKNEAKDEFFIYNASEGEIGKKRRLPPTKLYRYNIRTAQNAQIGLILSVYNAGPAKLRKAGYDINKMPDSTKAYIKKVMAIYNLS